MFCRQCGKSMEDGSSFCVHCGQRSRRWSDKERAMSLREELKGNFTLLIPSVLSMVWLIVMYFVSESSELKTNTFVVAGFVFMLVAYWGVLAHVAARRTLLFSCLYLLPYMLAMAIVPLLISGDVYTLLEKPSSVISYVGLLVFPLVATLLIHLFQLLLSSRLQVVTDILAPLIVGGLFIVVIYLEQVWSMREFAQKMEEAGVTVTLDETFKFWDYAIFAFCVVLCNGLLHLRSKEPKPALVCAACGADNVAGSHYCEECGTSFRGEAAPSIVCVACGSVIPEASKFCLACGRVVPPPTPKCKACGAPIVLGTRFCGQCGNAYY